MSDKFGEWIPCSERLPKKDDIYLVTMRIWENKDEGPVVNCLRYDLDDEDWECYDWGWVLAWMPLPEPYAPSKKGVDNGATEIFAG